MQLSNTQPTVLPVTYEEFKERQQKRAADNSNDSMGQQDFLNLMITQMKHQDPLNPMESADFTSQTTAFSQLEQMINLNEKFDSYLEYQMQLTAADQQLVAASSFIGREVEYDTNTIKISNGSTMPLSFYSEKAGYQGGNVKIYNANDELVGLIELNEIKKGANVVSDWDGKGIGDTTLEDGMYYFEVEGVDADGKDLTIATYGTSQVIGVKMSGGKMYFEVENGLVPAESVYGVKETAKTTGDSDS